jgi:hypothetical protein
MAAPSSNRRMTIILVIGGVLVAMLAAFNLLGGGGGDDSSTTSDTVPPAATTPSPGAGEGGTPAAAPATPAPAAPTLPNQEFDVFATRNPFEPAIQIVSETTPVEEPTTTPPAGGTAPAPTEPPAGSPEPSAGTTVALIDVFDQNGVTMARIQVGSTEYTVAAGQTFAVSYKVVSLSGTCGQFLYGDSPFSLCENEQITK